MCIRAVHGNHSTDGWVDMALGLFALRWGAADEVDPSLRWKRRRTSARHVSAWEWLGISGMKSTVGMVQVVHANFAVEPFSLEMVWPFRQYYVNTFYRSRRYLHTEESSL